MTDHHVFETKKITILPHGRMTAKNAALYLGLAEKTLAMYRCAGTGPAFSKIGGRIYYTPAALNAWLGIDDKCASPAPKEPKTLTVEDIDGERPIYFINPVTKGIRCHLGCSVDFYYALKAHVADGHKLYASEEDAERGKAMGWS